MVAWDRVTRTNVLRAIQEYDRHGPEEFFSAHGFAPTTTYELVWQDRSYPPKAILGTAYEFATGQRLASGDFEGEDRRREGTGKAGIHRPDAVTCQAKLHVRPCLHPHGTAVLISVDASVVDG